VWQFGVSPMHPTGCARGVPTTCDTGVYDSLASGVRVGHDAVGEWGSGSLAQPPPSLQTASPPALPPAGNATTSESNPRAFGPAEVIIVIVSVLVSVLLCVGAGVAYFHWGPRAPKRVLPRPPRTPDRNAQMYIQERISPMLRPQSGGGYARSSQPMPPPRVRVGSRINANVLASLRPGLRVPNRTRVGPNADTFGSVPFPRLGDDVDGEDALHPDVVAALHPELRAPARLPRGGFMDSAEDDAAARGDPSAVSMSTGDEDDVIGPDFVRPEANLPPEPPEPAAGSQPSLESASRKSGSDRAKMFKLLGGALRMGNQRNGVSADPAVAPAAAHAADQRVPLPPPRVRMGTRTKAEQDGAVT
jgi:hypothetical protein